ncbi:unnamed protein product, partial [Prorocentrum cordatum]
RRRKKMHRSERFTLPHKRAAEASNQASKSLREIPRARGRTSDDAHSVRSATDELVPWVRAAHCVEQPIG